MKANMTMQASIETRLKSTFNIEHMDVVNESHMHNVAPGSESHFKVTIVSEDFDDKMLLKRHRMVNSALVEEMQSIHALALHTFTPAEWSMRQGKVAETPKCRGGGKNQ